MEQISIFPDVLGIEIERLVEKEYERTKNDDYDFSIKEIRSLHEGYGYEAEGFANLTSMHKKLKDNLGAFLNTLSQSNGSAEQHIVDIYGNAQEAAKAAIHLAAIAKRIMSEVKYDADLPPEAYGQDIESGETEPNFEETE